MEARKVTVSLPNDLLRYVDLAAQDRGVTRSEFIGRALEDVVRHEAAARLGDERFSEKPTRVLTS